LIPVYNLGLKAELQNWVLVLTIALGMRARRQLSLVFLTRTLDGEIVCESFFAIVLLGEDCVNRYCDCGLKDIVNGNLVNVLSGNPLSILENVTCPSKRNKPQKR
jgi:hypothetical protein